LDDDHVLPTGVGLGTVGVDPEGYICTDDLSAAPPNLPTVSDTPRNYEEPGEEAYDDNEGLGRKSKPRKSYTTKNKGHPKNSRQKDGSDGDLNKQKSGNRHKRKNKKSLEVEA
jgi:hypothetical protein